MSSEGAALAVATLNGRELKGRPIHVRFDRAHLESAGGISVFVGNIPWEISSEQLSQMFTDWAPLDVHVKTNMAGRSRGFAIVKFATQEQADAAVSQMDGMELNGRHLQVREDKAPHERAVGAPRIFVGNLPATANQALIQALFSSAGTVNDVRMAKYANGTPKGWAIVTMDSAEEAQQAIYRLHGTELEGQVLVVRGDRKRL